MEHCIRPQGEMCKGEMERRTTHGDGEPPENVERSYPNASASMHLHSALPRLFVTTAERSVIRHLRLPPPPQILLDSPSTMREIRLSGDLRFLRGIYWSNQPFTGLRSSSCSTLSLRLHSSPGKKKGSGSLENILQCHDFRTEREANFYKYPH